MIMRPAKRLMPDEEQFLNDVVPEPELTDIDLVALCKQQDSDAYQEYMDVELKLHWGAG